MTRVIRLLVEFPVTKDPWLPADEAVIGDDGVTGSQIAGQLMSELAECGIRATVEVVSEYDE